MLNKNVRALTSSKAKDADTKQALWSEALNKMFSFKIWEKLHHFYILTRTTADSLYQPAATEFQRC